MKKLKHGMVFILTLSIFIIFACLSYVRTPITYSDVENRKLAQIPNLDEDFATNLNTYSNDQFYFRDEFMRMKSNLQYMLGQRKMNGIWIGKDGMLFQEGKRLKANQKHELAKAINHFTSNKKMKVKMMLIADRINLLPDLLEDYMITCDSFSNIHALLTELQSVEYLDVNQRLLNQKDAFYQSDHHYTTKGAYLCFQTYFDTYLKDQVKYEYDIYPYTDLFEGTLSNQSGYRKSVDQVDLYIEKDCDIKYYVTIDDQEYSSVYGSEPQNPYEVFFNGNHSMVKIDTTANNEKHLLVIKDSFANAFVPFLIPYYHQITMVDPRYYFDDLDTYIQENEVNEILFLYSTQTLFSDTSLIELIGE